MLRKGDIAIFDFEGIVDGETVENATAKNFSLEIGSGRLIEGFEDGMVGMKYDETRELDLKFPENYHAKDLAGKDVKFVITLHEIQEKAVPEIDDELAKKLIPNDPEMTLEKLKTVVKESLESEKTSKLYNEELKPKLLEELVKAFDFELPEIIVDEEINSLVNQKLQGMSEDELKATREDEKKIEALKKEVEPEAKERVKTTLIVDELAKQENITISDQEVTQTMYYEAMQMGQDPKQMLEYYQQQGLMPIVKMSMLEDRVLSHLLNKKNEKK
jgi:trigger factor